MSWAQVDPKLEEKGKKTVEQKIPTSENISALVKVKEETGNLIKANLKWIKSNQQRPWSWR